MEILLQILLNSAFIGSIYFLLAIGFTIIYGLLRVIHFVHVDVGVMGVFFFIFLTSQNIPICPSLLMAIIFCSLVGCGIFFFFYKPFIKREIPTLVPLIVSVGISFILQHLLLLAFRDKPYSIHLSSQLGKIYTLFGAHFKIVHIIGLVIAVIVLIAICTLNKTNFGRSIKAISEDKELAVSCGIRPDRTISWTFIIFSPIALLGIFLIGMDTGIFAKSGTLLTIKSFTISVIGGIGSISGVFIVSMLLALVERIVGVFITSGMKDIVVFVILLVILLLRPEGILRRQ